MSGLNFHDTIMGRRFFNGQIPDITGELRKLNTNIEALSEAVSLLASLMTQEETENGCTPEQEHD